MKLLISYFYQIRFFTSDLIPLSTAVWDPKWFMAADKVKIGNNSVLYGLKYTPFVPGDGCNNLCHGSEGCPYNPSDCAFLKAYRAQLDRLDFNKVYNHLQLLSDAFKRDLSMVEEPTLVFIVYEPPYKKCSEREVLKAWFQDHGVELKEYERK